MNEQTTIRAAVAISPSAAVVYLEGVDCPHCATPINQSYRVASACRDTHQHAVETVWNWRQVANSGPEDYRVVDVVIVDTGDPNANMAAARMAALSDHA